MDKLPRIEAETISGPHSESSENLEQAQQAAEMAARLFSYYPPPDVGDPQNLLTGAVKMFLAYPMEAVLAVVDPTSGLPATSKWAPNLAEIRQALEAAMVPIKWRLRQEQLAEEARAQIAARKPLQITDARPRPTYEELQRRCHAVGLMIGPKGSRLPPIDPLAVRDKYGISADEWNAIPAGKPPPGFKKLGAA